MTAYQLGTSSSRRSEPLPRLGEHPEITVEKSALSFTGRPSFRSWEEIGRQILSVIESSTWWIADWLAYGETAFQDRYVEAVKRTNLSYQTLRNYVWVARRFERSRRHDALSFGHHAEVAALDPAEQGYWLRKAEEGAWSRNQLRREVRESLANRNGQESCQPAEIPLTSSARDDARSGPATAPRSTLVLALSDEQVALFEATAKEQRQQLLEWVIRVLEAAARGEDI